jgi:hypothetical protein
MKPPVNRSHVALFVDWSATFRRFSVLSADFILFRLLTCCSSVGAFNGVIRFSALPANFASALVML